MQVCLVVLKGVWESWDTLMQVCLVVLKGVW